MTYIVNPRNKKEEKVLQAILNSLSIGYYTEEKEEEALLKAMEKGRKTKLHSATEKKSFLHKLKTAK
jgi:hypothetical protein